MKINLIKRKPHELVEAVFDIAYLLFAIGAGLYLVAKAQGKAVVQLYGALALVLGSGDAFHLIPRVYGCLTGRMAQLTRPLGFGKLVTSLTMTAFYVMLIHIWQMTYGMIVFFPAIYALAAVRVVLTLLPQNRWFDENPPLSWAIARNLPFILLGLCALALFMMMVDVAVNPFRYMPLAIALSFAFYIPVVLFSQKKPAIGALMLPMTCAYIWMICMGFSLLHLGA